MIHLTLLLLLLLYSSWPLRRRGKSGGVD